MHNIKSYNGNNDKKICNNAGISISADTSGSGK